MHFLKQEKLDELEQGKRFKRLDGTINKAHELLKNAEAEITNIEADPAENTAFIAWLSTDGSSLAAKIKAFDFDSITVTV